MDPQRAALQRLAGRLQRCLARWPAPLRRALRRYLASRPGGFRGRRRHSRAAGWPGWLALPVWLHAYCAPGRTAAARAWLGDVQWAQYCLFLFIRIHDDFVDRQGVRAPELVFAADRLLFEAETCLAGRLREGAFWRLYRRLVTSSLEAIASADALQQRRRFSTKALLEEYARVSSVLKVGAAAVCVACGQQARLPLVERLADELAVANQIIDDLMDVDEDLARGRVNYAAAVLAGRGRRPGNPRHLRTLIERRALRTDGLFLIVREARRHIARADRAAAALNLAEARRHIANLDADLVRLERLVHRAQVAALFGSGRARQRPT